LCGLLFPVPAAGLGAFYVCRCEAGGTKEPAGKDGFWRNGAGFLSEDDKNCLSYIFREMRKVRLPQGHGMNQIDVTVHQGTESLLGIGPRILVQKIHVAGFHNRHHMNNSRPG